VAVIAEDPLVRSGLVSLLGVEPDLSVVSQGSAPDAALGDVSNAELLLWDLGPRVTPAPSSFALERTPTLALVRDEESALELLRAGALKISDHTAKFHVTAILNKLGADTRTEAVVTAARRGLLML